METLRFQQTEENAMIKKKDVTIFKENKLMEPVLIAHPTPKDRNMA